MNFLKHKNGESIIEVTLASMIILVAIMTAFKILTLAFAQKNMTESRMIGIHLAREGMEAVHYIRDYNWLYYGSNQRICWNYLQDNNDDGTLNDTECTEDGSNGFNSTQIGTGDNGALAGTMEYALKQEGNHWLLTRMGINGHTIANGDWATITKDNVGINADKTTGANNTDTEESFRICKDSNDVLYTSCLNTSADKNNRTKFVRYVKIQYAKDPADPSSTGGLTEGQKQNMFQATVGVKWLENNTLQDVEITSILSDFYKRTPLDEEN